MAESEDHESQESASEPIRIFVSNQHGYVWTPEGNFER